MQYLPRYGLDKKSYMSFRLVPKLVTLNDLERRNGPCFALFLPNLVVSGRIAYKWLTNHNYEQFAITMSSSRRLQRDCVRRPRYKFLADS